MKSYIPKDWRIWFGLSLTFLWFCFLLIYIARNVGWGSFLDLPIEEMGTFLEGAFAFLAFLWLVIGLFIQQSVLAENNEELRRNNAHSEKQAQAIAATEMNARQETFFKIAESTRRQLGSITGLLFLSSQGPIGNNAYLQKISRRSGLNSQAAMWKSFPGCFSPWAERRWTGLICSTAQKSAVATRKIFLVGFDRLLELAKGCDTDNIILDSLIYSGHGILNIRMRELHPDIKFEPIVGTDTEQYLDSMINSGLKSS